MFTLLCAAFSAFMTFVDAYNGNWWWACFYLLITVLNLYLWWCDDFSTEWK